MRPMNFRRTFYPVGQGAFYVEEFKLSEDSKFTIVYDCGSTTLGVREFKKRIKGIFPKEYQIDVLFISHFHVDHINGIEALKEHCKIRRVVLPLINNDEETILEFSNYIETKKKHSNLIRNPKRYFGEETIIIKIKSISIDSRLNEGETRNILDIIRDEELPSGTIFTYPNIDWLFIPFNYKQNERRVEFEENLRYIGKGLSLEDIKTIDDIKKYGKELKEAYEAVEGDLNENSMALYSGPHKNPLYLYPLFFYRYRYMQFNLFRRYKPLKVYHKKILSGCLYTGDINLNERNIVEDIEKQLGKVMPFIGTLQIPHHGSIHNFKESILENNISCAVCSFGIKNSYGHPAYTVIDKVADKEVLPCLVTEDFGTIIIQEGFD